MVIDRIINNPIDSNSFVIYKEGNTGCIVVDPGTSDCSDLLLFLDNHRLKPEYIFLTHEHFDHIWGVNRLKEIYYCKTICSRNCAEKIVDIKKNMSVFFNQTGFKSYPADILIENIEYSLTWEGLKFEFIVSKGHTEGSMCIYGGSRLFSGDTIIKDHKTVVKFPGGNKGDLQKSLNLIFSKFEGQNVCVCPGHGECFNLNEITSEQLV